MKDFSDEDLSRYMDGQASTELSQAIESAMAENTELSQRIERMQAADRLLRAAFDAQLGKSDVPQNIADKLAGVRRLTPAPQRKFPAPLWGLAATVALGMAIGWGVAQWRQPHAAGNALALQRARLVAGATLADTLSNARSGVLTTTSAGVVKVVLSVRTSDGTYCRQFDVASDSRSASGLACRSGTEWQVDGIFTNKRRREDNAFHAASGPDDQRMDALLAEKGESQALDRAAEDAAIKSGWKKR